MTRFTEQEFERMMSDNPDVRVAETVRMALGASAGPRQRASRPSGPVPTEHEEQVRVVKWAEAHVGRWPELRMLAAIPNGGARNIQTAALLKAEGVQAGFPDLILCTQRTGPEGRRYGALFLELKRRDHSNNATPMQKAWLDALRMEGYQCVVAYGADEAIAAIEHYLEMKR